MFSMQLPDEIIILICGIGAFQSFFLAIYIFSLGKKAPPSNIFLGGLFLALAIRVSKSILWAFWPDTPLWVLNLGFAAHAAVGPFLLLYLFSHLSLHRKPGQRYLLHFLPALLILLFIGKLENNAFWYQGGYALLLYQQLAYMTVCLVLFFTPFGKSRYGFREVGQWEKTWLQTLWLGVAIWGFSYFSNFILGFTSYLLGPLVYSLLIYLLSFYGFRHQQIFRKQQKLKKYKNINLSAEETDRYKNKLLQWMEQTKPYLEADFTLSKLSDQVALPSYLLSHILNDVFQQNFSEFTNTYRIEEAQNMLQNSDFDHLKIASIAYDCGFNSLSSFNAAFKKIAHTTPSKYRLNRVRNEF